MSGTAPGISGTTPVFSETNPGKNGSTPVSSETDPGKNGTTPVSVRDQSRKKREYSRFYRDVSRFPFLLLPAGNSRSRSGSTSFPSSFSKYSKGSGRPAPGSGIPAATWGRRRMRKKKSRMGGEEAHLDLPGGHGVEAVPKDQVVQLLAGGG